MALPANATAVNLGCGTSVAEGWINIDNSPNARLSRYPPLRWLLWKLGVLSDEHYQVRWSRFTLIHDLRKRLPFAKSSIDYVYTSHTLEHLGIADAHNLVKDIARVLKSGGQVRIVVPDLALGARRYLNALQRNQFDQNAAPQFLNWLQLSKPGVRTPHLWMYDAASLGALLTDNGLINIRICDFASGCVPDCELLDSRPDESLYMEGEKP